MPAPDNQKCDNCLYFLQVEDGTGKGVCRINPPMHIAEAGQSPTKDDPTGRRWPVCWGNEWCGKWKAG